MPWFTVDDGFHSHPKVVGLSLSAVGLWTKAGSWSAHQLTDGLLTRAVVKSLGGSLKQCAELVDAGLWVEVDGGWQFHDWLVYQKSRETVLEKRSEAKERMRSVRANKPRTERELRAKFAVGSPNPSPSPSPIQFNSEEESVRDAPAREQFVSRHETETDYAIGARFIEAATGRPVDDPVSWRAELVRIGSKPQSEREAALAAIRADVWCQANQIHVTPKHVLKKWGQYATGNKPMQLVAAETKQQPGAAEVEACRAETARWKEATRAANDDASREIARQKWEQSSLRLRELKEKYSWTG